MKMNSEYFVALAATFEQRYGVQFQGIRDGAVKDPRERLVQFKTNMDVAMSVLDRDGLGDWLADRLVSIGDTLTDESKVRIAVDRDPFQDDRLRVANLPLEPQKVKVVNRVLRRHEGRRHHALPQGRRGGGHAPRHLRDREVGELRHRQPLPDHRRRPLRVDQPRARQPVGSLRPRDQSARHAGQGRDPGGRQRLHRHRPGEPERLGRSQEVRRRVGDQRDLRRVHAADVHAGARVEPAEPGQQVPHGRAAHPGRPLGPRDGGRRAHALRHLRAAGVEAVPARARRFI